MHKIAPVFRVSPKNAIVCAMNFVNPTPEQISSMLRSIHTIAVVGLSPNPARPSFRVAQAMQSHGFSIVPVRPLVEQVLGVTAYPDLASLPFKVDMVNVFRAAEYVSGIVDSCISLGVTRLWLQDGVIDEAAALRAQLAGITVVMNRCIWRDYACLK